MVQWTTTLTYNAKKLKWTKIFSFILFVMYHVIYVNKIDWDKFWSVSAFSEQRLKSEVWIKYSVFEHLNWLFCAAIAVSTNLFDTELKLTCFVN